MTSQRSKSDNHPNKALELLSAIVVGDAAIEDIATELRRHGIESVNGVLEMVRKVARERVAAQENAIRPINLQGMRKKSSPERVSRIVQRVPKIPFLLNGTMYDPKDIVRFNGHELHLVPVVTGKHMVAVEDRDVIANWWLLTYLSGAPEDDSIEYGGMGPGPQSAPPVGPEEFHFEGEAPPVSTKFYEHPDLQGDYLELKPNRGYWDLTKVSSGLFGWGTDWNDRISSVSMYFTKVCVLHDDIHWEGSTLTILEAKIPSGGGGGGAVHPPARALGLVGWDDRASSIETW